MTRRVKRLRYPMTCAYAFTDGGLNLFNLYVALSRSSGRETIRLLRDFDEKMFLTCHSIDLLAEDDRLALLDEQNKHRWYRLRPAWSPGPRMVVAWYTT